MASYDNPLPPPDPASLAVEPIVPTPPAPPPLPPPDLPYVEDPPWSAAELLAIGAVLLGSILIFLMVGMAILAATQAVSMPELAKNPSAALIVSAMTASYAVTLGAAYALIAARRQPFWRSLRWNWPRAAHVAVSLSAGLGLAIFVSVLGKFLPMPKSLPIEKFFRDARSAWLLVFFGLLVAPLVEEILFRGLLYPVLNRSCRRLLGDSRRLRTAALLLVLLLPWGHLVHRLPHRQASLCVATAILGTLVWFFIRLVTAGAGKAAGVLAPGFVFSAWALLARLASDHTLRIGSIVVAALALVLLTLALARLSEAVALRLGVALSIMVTSIAFATIHAEQLANSLAPLLLILVVGLVLTTVRAVTKSLATSLLVHMGYNGTLFALMFVATSGFQHMERLSH